MTKGVRIPGTKWYRHAVEYVGARICTKCCQEKEITEFTKTPGNTKGRSWRCKSCDRLYYQANRERGRLGQRRRSKKIKELVYEHYGNKCQCCGEKTFLFLSIDHINNDGAKRKKNGEPHGREFYYWIVRNNFPDDLQILCMNCNFGKRMNHGICPHVIN